MVAIIDFMTICTLRKKNRWMTQKIYKETFQNGNCYRDVTLLLSSMCLCKIM